MFVITSKVTTFFRETVIFTALFRCGKLQLDNAHAEHTRIKAMKFSEFASSCYCMENLVLL